MSLISSAGLTKPRIAYTCLQWVVTKKRNEPKPPETSPSHPKTSRKPVLLTLKPAETSPSSPETSGNQPFPPETSPASSFVEVIPILYNSRVHMRRSSPRAPPFFNCRTRRLEGIVLIVQDGVLGRCVAVNKTEDFIHLDGLDNLVRKQNRARNQGNKCIL